MHDVAQGGRTVLFVSHNMGAVASLCNRVVVLNDGRIKYEGENSCWNLVLPDEATLGNTSLSNFRCQKIRSE